MTGIENFLSEESVAIHKEYLRMIKLKYSILECAIGKINGMDINEILSMNLNQKDKRKNTCIDSCF